MKRLVRLFCGPVFLLCLGIIFACAFFLHSPRVLLSIERRIAAAADIFLYARSSMHITDISFLKLSVTFNDVTVIPLYSSDEWRATARKVEVSFSLRSLLRTGKIGIATDVQGMQLFSHVKENRLCAIEHFKPILADGPENLPFNLQSLLLNCSLLTIIDKENDYQASCRCDAVIKVNENNTHLQIFLKDGSFQYAETILFNNVRGNVAVGSDDRGKVTCLSDCTFQLLGLSGGQYNCSLSGQWKNNEASFTITNDDHSISVSRCILKMDDQGLWVDTQGLLPLKTCIQVAMVSLPIQLDGVCSFSCKGILAKALAGFITVSDIDAGGLKVGTIETSLANNANGTSGLLKYNFNQQVMVLDWSWDRLKQEMKLVGINPTLFSLSETGWQVPSGNMKIKGVFSPEGAATCAHHFFIEHEKNQACLALSGKLVGAGLQWKYAGTFFTNHHEYEVVGSYAPFSLTLVEKNQKPSVEIKVHGAQFLAKVDTVFVQTILKEYFDFELLTAGDIICKGCIDTDSKVQGNVTFNDGFMRLPQMYNFVEHFRADFFVDSVHKTGSFKNVEIGFKNGSIQSLCARGGYDPAAKEWWVYLPFTFADCLINGKKDWYVWSSGALVAEKMPGNVPSLRGFVAADRSHIKEHIFQQEPQVEMGSRTTSPSFFSDTVIDVSFLTKVPIAVKTVQLESQALAGLTCKGTIVQPRLEGTVVLEGGMMHFPAYSLSIVQGKLSFTGGPFTEPVVEIVAQGRAKRYHITLSVGGTAQDPQIVFDSIPSLSQEQIMMLLLAGSEEESLNIVAPALIMRNIETIIFGSSYKISSDFWAEGLRRIKFVPRFTNQTGRGGFKGVLEIELSKKLRATIEKNFSLTEDVAFGFEYAITDDVSVQGGVDERGDVGAQIEMRFKF